MAPTQPRTLEGKVAIVTGSTRGIGRSIALDLAARGAKVTITYTSDKSQSAAKELISEIKSSANSDAIAVQADLRDTASPKKIVDETVKAFGKDIDILVNNAAEFASVPLPEITLEHYDSILNLNLRAPLLMLQAVLPHLRRPGRIINLSSVGARGGYPGVSMYAASKGALEAMSRTWATELGGDGTTVNCVNPGPVQTEMFDAVDPEIVKPQLEATAVEKRVAKTEEIAEIVGFLAEGRSSWVSGQCIGASGGYQMY
ncbi:3-ketoacyl-acyl carrier protein reductase [Zymoseptoria brevis]|uniref:3-ketoacyl-acyl carrier protein reductase n=1 Tax=Zymoseptoria brevis TaxID=1047168 RepID=A0A0F4GY48_9PEZI|nr:3-ketoacyl-acyl carrier protein reductase [Zymoseptoria brevis]